MARWRVSSQAVLLVAMLLSAGQAWAQNVPGDGGLEQPIGKVQSVDGVVTIEHTVAVVLQANLPGGAEQAKADDFVYRGDVVQTGADGKLALIFGDGSAFNLSNNAHMVLDRFIYDPNGTANSSLVSLTKGNFTFVAGAVAKSGDMKVDTPVGTMGIRGTTPRVEIAADGTVKFSTLVEGKKDVAPAPSQQRVVPRQQQARRARSSDVRPEESAAFNRLLHYEYRICQHC